MKVRVLRGLLEWLTIKHCSSPAGKGDLVIRVVVGDDDGRWKTTHLGR